MTKLKRGLNGGRIFITTHLARGKATGLGVCSFIHLLGVRGS